MNISEQALFYVAEDDMTIRDVLETLYGNPPLRIINHLLKVNMHLRGDWIRAGQMLIVTPPDSKNLVVLEQQMTIAARHVDVELNKLSERERQLLARHYALLSNFASYNIARYGWTITSFHHHKKNLERYITRVDELLNDSLESDACRDADCSSPHRPSQQRQLLIQIHQTMLALLRCQLFERDTRISTTKTNLGLVKNALVHQWKTQVGPAKTIASFKTHYAHILKGAQSLARLGRVSFALEVSAQQKKQIRLFDAEEALATVGHPDFGWPFSEDDYHLLVDLEGVQSDWLRCSIVAGPDKRLPGSAATSSEPLFSRCYRKA